MAFGGTVKLTGESEYRQALNAITNNLKVLNSEMKVVTSQFDRNDKSVSNLSQQNTVLNKKIDEQRQKVQVLQSALASAEAETGRNSNTTAKWKIELNNAQAELNRLEKNLRDNTEAMDDFGDETAESAENTLKLGDIIKANLISEGIMTGIKALGSAIKGVGNALIGIGKQAVSSYGEYQQLVGGVETLFKESAGKVQEYADIAFATAGISANKYMETVTSFSASLIQSLGGDTARATELANTAIIDMSDNANKMGTSIEMIQNAYQGFAKQNYTMLDNLKLGYGGTQKEMARLLADAGISGDRWSIDSKGHLEAEYSAIIEAIHIIQTEMGIAGTTTYEAGQTITGSVGSMRSAWQNLVTGIADDNADFPQLVSNFVNSLIGADGKSGALGNLLPRIEMALNGVAKLISSLATSLAPQLIGIGINLASTLVKGIVENLPAVAESLMSVAPLLVSTFQEVLNSVVQFGFKIIDSISGGLQANIPMLLSKGLDLLNSFANFLTVNVPILVTKGVEMIRNLVKGLMNALPELIARVPEIISKFANVINDNAPTIIQGGFGMIMDIIKGIINAIPTLVANIPKIITAIIDVWEAVNWLNLGKKAIDFIGNGITNMKTFAKDSMVKVKDAIVDAVKNLPENLLNIGKNMISNFGNAITSMKNWAVTQITKVATSVVSGIKDILSVDNLKSIGKNLVQGLWNGISDMTGWVLNKIKGFGSSVLNGIKSFFGIHSPSTLFRDEVGKNLALGVGEGFDLSMADVTRDMQNAIPTEFDTNVNMGANHSAGSNYDFMVMAFKEALKDVKVVMNGREMGTFVKDTIEREVFA